jgi:GH24 family phage-related lysozyme (muramidase)
MGAGLPLLRGAAAAALLAAAAMAEEAAPADTLVELRRQFGACLSRTPLVASGSRVTIVFMAKRDGSIFGKPRITYSRLEGDAEARERFLADAERAVDSCLPLKVTPALGAAIAGRMFSITLGREKPQRAI